MDCYYPDQAGSVEGFGVMPKDMVLSMMTHKHTNTLAQRSEFQGSNRGPLEKQESVHAEGHIAAPCRCTVRHINRGGGDGSRV